MELVRGYYFNEREHNFKLFLVVTSANIVVSGREAEKELQMLNKIIDELETYFGDDSDAFDVEELAHYIAFNLGCKSIDDLTYADFYDAALRFEL